MTESPSDVPNKGPLFVKVTAVLTCIAFVLVAYRLLWKGYIKSTFSADDIIISFSMAVQIVNTVMGDLACHFAFGRHKADIVKTGGNVVLALKYFWLFQILYKLVLCLNKLSFLAFYLRIFPNRTFRLICWITISLVLTSTFGFVIATIFQCIPVRASWYKHIPKKCVSNASFRWSWAGYNTLMDIWVCLMPLPVLAQLHLDRIRKVGVMLVFGMGLFVCVTSIIRMWAMEASTKTTDPTWGSFDALMWSAIEASTGIICACLPFLKHPIQKMLPGWFVSLSNGSRKSRSRTRPGYHMSRLGSRSGNHTGDNWGMSRGEGEREVEVDGDADADAESLGSEGPIAKNQIMVKTGITMRSEMVYPK
ncbi:plasma membrane Pth11-like protein [Aspergillus sclerotioniger CBS 115572]|uniref:Plasma membrane Pth11-like protein n=1 Tax=Aspergillus sclerotioniger CBS 115572 TaxID=1450535 RepID=A0A317WYY6_9EURO|nr:plasma membrane Pth11-like protein [Aspergillus sclerotioniger CBS 115572]PWY91596.1 plasma membrane Pth11-like protein [Aspergillus sclerotioniger CBS 115572]